MILMSFLDIIYQIVVLLFIYEPQILWTLYPNPRTDFPWQLAVQKSAFNLVDCSTSPQQGSVVVQHSPGMREIGGLIPGRVNKRH